MLASEDVALLVWSPLAGGLLGGKISRDAPSADGTAVCDACAATVYHTTTQPTPNTNVYTPTTSRIAALVMSTFCPQPLPCAAVTTTLNDCKVMKRRLKSLRSGEIDDGGS
ncbi:MAG: hypothetical protein NVSMB64_22450 [Candidatus Velthaea sp.]